MTRLRTLLPYLHAAGAGFGIAWAVTGAALGHAPLVAVSLASTLFLGWCARDAHAAMHSSNGKVVER